MPPIIPTPDEVTVCEVRGSLRTRAASEGGKEAAVDLYGRNLGRWYPPLVLVPSELQNGRPLGEEQPENLGQEKGGGAEQQEEQEQRQDQQQQVPRQEQPQEQEPSHRDGPPQLGEVRDEAAHGRSWLDWLTPAAIKCTALPPLPLPSASVAWHPAKERLVIAQPSWNGQGAALVFDVAAPVLLSSPPKQPEAQQSPLLSLSHALQCCVSSVAWRPTNPRQVAVGARGGVYLWCLPEAAASSRDPTFPPPGHTPRLAAPSVLSAIVETSTSGTPHYKKVALARAGASLLSTRRVLPWIASLLPHPLGKLYSGDSVCCLDFSPCGLLLAGAVLGASPLFIWEVATGRLTHLRHSLGQPSLVKWARDGEYLLACAGGVRIVVWETFSCTCAEVALEGQAGCVSGLEWGTAKGSSTAPRPALVSCSNSPALCCLYISGRPPTVSSTVSVDLASLLLDPTAGAGPSSASFAAIAASVEGISALAWDPSGRRLAVTFNGGPLASAYVFLFATTTETLFQAKLVGYIRGPPRMGHAYPKALSVSFAPSFKEGALLAVVWDHGLCSSYPLLLESNP